MSRYFGYFLKVILMDISYLYVSVFCFVLFGSINFYIAASDIECLGLFVPNRDGFHQRLFYRRECSFIRFLAILRTFFCIAVGVGFHSWFLSHRGSFLLFIIGFIFALFLVVFCFSFFSFYRRFFRFF